MAEKQCLLDKFLKTKSTDKRTGIQQLLPSQNKRRQNNFACEIAKV